MEVIANMGGSGESFEPRISLNDSHTDELWLADELGIKPGDLRKTLKVFAQVRLIDPASFESGEIFLPQMLEYRDEYSAKKRSKSRQTPDSVPTQSGVPLAHREGELEGDIDKKEKRRLHDALPSQRTAQTADAGANDLVDPAKGIFLRIPLSDGTEYPVHTKTIQDWQREFPGVDVKQAIRGTRGWALARQPHERKARHEIRQSLRSFLGKKQDGAVMPEEWGL